MAYISQYRMPRCRRCNARMQMHATRRLVVIFCACTFCNVTIGWDEYVVRMNRGLLDAQVGVGEDETVEAELAGEDEGSG